MSSAGLPGVRTTVAFGESSGSHAARNFDEPYCQEPQFHVSRFARASVDSLLTLGFWLVAGMFISRLLGVEGRAAYALAVRTAGIVVAVAQGHSGGHARLTW